MDKLWIDDNLNLEMMAYNILEIGYQIGYLEFVDEADTFSQILKGQGTCSSYKEQSIWRFMDHTSRQEN